MPIDFGYAQARVQARHGDRLTPSRWRAVESAADLGRYIHALRGTALAPAIQHFTGTASPHAIERTLRAAWRTEVERASRWVPRAWRSSVVWTAWLSDLEAIGYLLDGKEVLPWMHEDAVLNRFAREDVDERRGALVPHVGPLPERDSFDASRWWYEQWLERLPTADLRETGLDDLVHYLKAFGKTRWESTSPSTARDESGEALAKQMTRLLHRRAGRPVSVYCHLVLTALELLRLRGGLVRHSLVNAGVTGGRT
jgi:hypothetical protein